MTKVTAEDARPRVNNLKGAKIARTPSKRPIAKVHLIRRAASWVGTGRDIWAGTVSCKEVPSICAIRASLRARRVNQRLTVLGYARIN
jgi:hypothetical protein